MSRHIGLSLISVIIVGPVNIERLLYLTELGAILPDLGDFSFVL